MKPVERIKQLLDAEDVVREKDKANIYNPTGMDAAVRKRAFIECIKALEKLDQI